ncbi:hypothetical protein [Halopelagius longus]|uniref:Uncharacterized protein n=1 Tax=Halopelagius longus TaxID=1236180 RepID=A0A1H1FNT2_9EURY|nr:hypothetical protein [Halopelagius longus]RDI70006.1 hypothetical protein DWB78_15350 [Halopelagius longus]SDR02571.1 hypothetical protein SAMN05216278_3320 [Halopelagius longus]
MTDKDKQSRRADGLPELGTRGAAFDRRTAMKAAVVGLGAASLPVGSVAAGGSDGSDDVHTLMVTANGPVEYEFTVDGTLEADTVGGDFSADEDDEPGDGPGPYNAAITDVTGPLPEDAGGTTYLGDRYRTFGYMQFDVEDSGYDVNVYYNGDPVAPSDVPEWQTEEGELNLFTIAANGPTEYTIQMEGTLNPDTVGGNFAADDDDEPVENDDGTLTAADETGPLPEDAGGLTYLGDRYLFCGSVEELSLDPGDSSYNVEVYLDERIVSPSTVRNNSF